jgi:hypothetical protein
MSVTVSLLARKVQGVVEEVHDEGRRLIVLTEDGERQQYALHRATGHFMRDGMQSGARLSFDEPGG